MSNVNEIYKCKECGLMVEVVIAGDCTPECCGKPMQLLKENTTDGAKEKHVPVDHPMTEAHYIQWIELVTENGVLRQHLTPQDQPFAEFKTDAKEVYAREFCNLHGLWKS